MSDFTVMVNCHHESGGRTFFDVDQTGNFSHRDLQGNRITARDLIDFRNRMQAKKILVTVVTYSKPTEEALRKEGVLN